MIAPETLEQILQRFEFLEASLAQGGGGEAMAALGRDYAELRPVAEQARDYRALIEAIAEAEALRDDPEMRRLAEEELTALRARLPEAEAAMRLALLPRDAADARPAVLEIRAGTGGAEAALFAADLLRMYQRYAERMGWRLEILDESPGEAGGVKDLTAAVKGEGVYARLKRESGVHRVQRVPATESQGRIHTSAATVAVLPEAEAVDVQIDPSEIRIDTMRASGAGGQHVNTTDSAVRLTHLPTGIVVTSSEKSQHQNRARAMEVLRARLFDLKRREADAARAAERRGQVGSGDRSERIRTYNFPQGRVSDHRINLTLYRLGEILDGDLDEIVEALRAAEQAEKLAELDGMTRAALLAEGARRLAAAGIDDPGRDARKLLRWASGLEAAAFSARLDEAPSADEAARFAAGLASRAERRPLSQVIGAREFWGRMFEVTSDVLDPRPETETLIAAALDGPAPARVLDLGLGSGCILCTLLAEWPRARGVGVERSPAALAVARRNAEALGVAARAELTLGDWWGGVRGRFDLVASNPPYIPDVEFAALSPEVRLWEPEGALAPGGDGLGPYRILAAGLDAALAPGGRALFEFGAGQETAVEAIFAAAGFGARALHADLDGRPRCLELARL